MYKRFGVLFLVLFLLDQLTKLWALEKLTTPIVLIPGVLEFKQALNPGAVFSLPVPLWLLIMGAGVFFLYGQYWLWRRRDRLTIWDISWPIFLAGGFGNMIDRVYYQAVIDMISVPFFAVFNLADICITVGTALWLYALWTKKVPSDYTL